jgi:hypothetical protein
MAHDLYDIAIRMAPGEVYFWHNKDNACRAGQGSLCGISLTPDRAWRGIVTTPMNKFTGIYELSTDGI